VIAMRAPLEWIRQYVSLPDKVTVDDIVETYTRIGLEIEDVHRVPPTEGALVVGRVLEIEELIEFKKPIRFVMVDVGPGNGPDGSGDPRGVICGATNFAVGDAVVVALPGTVLPGGFVIASRPTYGKISDGMICSARELGIGTDHEGILVVAGPGDDAPEIGSDARGLIGADDAVIEFAITPDRGYALSIRGLARELAAAYDAPYTDVAAHSLPDAAPGYPIEIADPAGCSRFVAVNVAGVDPSARSPWLMRRRLQAAGVRSISLAVDVTNYVMIEYGQPLHAFDAAKLDGPIRVRRATATETLRTLDGSDRTLVDDDIVVTDNSGPISLAGVMGGETTEISSGTTNVVIEAANWDPASISRTVRRHRLPSEASRRFERGVDPDIAALAAHAAADMLIATGGGSAKGRTDVGAGEARPTIILLLSEPERLAGRSYGTGVAARRLAQVGCAVDARTGSDGRAELVVTPPSWRPDLTRPADLVEEIARLEGYDTITPVLPAAPPGTGLTNAQRLRRRTAAHLAAAGLTEVLSFPFMGERDLVALGIPEDDERRRATRLVNPLDLDRPLVQTFLLPGLLTTAQRNLSRGARDVALFEIGQVVRRSGPALRPPLLGVDGRPSDADLSELLAAVPEQPRHVAAVIAGHWERPGWWGPGRPADWADAVEVARRIIALHGVTAEPRSADLAPWHPGRCAAVSVGATVIGHAGELHPAVIERLGLTPRAVALELDLDAIEPAGTTVPPVVSAHPPVHLDVAVVLDRSVPAGDLTAALRAGGGDLLESVRLFDVYDGDQVGDGRRSLAFSLLVRATDRTLTLAEATAVRDAALAEARRRTGAELRS
jgi:phenylalanyl-tRNA synthetase beta chain